MEAEEFRRRITDARNSTGMAQLPFSKLVAAAAQGERGYSDQSYRRIEQGTPVHRPSKQRRWAELVAEVTGVPLEQIVGEHAPGSAARTANMQARLAAIEADLLAHDREIKQLRAQVNLGAGLTEDDLGAGLTEDDLATTAEQSSDEMTQPREPRKPQSVSRRRARAE